MKSSRTTHPATSKQADADMERPLLSPIPKDTFTLAGLRARGIEPPAAFICPITQDIMQHPVIGECGHTFERAAIQNHCKKNGFFSPTPGLQPYITDKLPENRLLGFAIHKYTEAIKQTGTEGHVDDWLPYKAPRIGTPFRQPMVFSDGSTVDFDQIDSLLVGQTISPFPPRAPLRKNETLIPNLNLRQLMSTYGRGEQLEEAKGASKVHVHDGLAGSPWNTKRQLERGCLGGVTASGVSFSSALCLFGFTSLTPHAAVIASAWALGAYFPGMLTSCISEYSAASRHFEAESAFCKRRRQSHFVRDVRYHRVGLELPSDDTDISDPEPTQVILPSEAAPSLQHITRRAAPAGVSV